MRQAQSDVTRSIIDLAGRLAEAEKLIEANNINKGKYSAQYDTIQERITELEVKIDRIINS